MNRSGLKRRVMRKNLFLLLVCLLIAVSAAHAADADLNSGWSYELLDDGTAMISGYSGNDSDIIIPDMLDGHTVTSLASDVFWFNEDITSVEIPESLTVIEDYVFLRENQRWLNSYRDNGKPYILVPEVARILVDYFAEYTDEVHVNPFLGAYNLEKISVSPDNPVLGISDGMLINKITKETIAYPAGLGGTAYAVPEGITAIGFQTFFGCSLESVSLPASVAEISQNPFIFCMALKEISAAPDNENFSVRDGVLVSRTGTLLSYPMASDAASYTVPDGVKAIGDGAFFNNMALEAIIFPEGVESIGCRAFDHCESLKTASLPDGLLSVGKAAFKNCNAL